MTTTKSNSQRFDEVWATPSGQALALVSHLGILRTVECGGANPRYTNAHLKAVQDRARSRYQRRLAQ